MTPRGMESCTNTSTYTIQCTAEHVSVQHRRGADHVGGSHSHESARILGNHSDRWDLCTLGATQDTVLDIADALYQTPNQHLMLAAQLRL